MDMFVRGAHTGAIIVLCFVLASGLKEINATLKTEAEKTPAVFLCGNPDK